MLRPYDRPNGLLCAFFSLLLSSHIRWLVLLLIWLSFNHSLFLSGSLSYWTNVRKFQTVKQIRNSKYDIWSQFIKMPQFQCLHSIFLFMANFWLIFGSNVHNMHVFTLCSFFSTFEPNLHENSKHTLKNSNEKLMHKYGIWCKKLIRQRPAD